MNNFRELIESGLEGVRAGVCAIGYKLQLLGETGMILILLLPNTRDSLPQRLRERLLHLLHLSEVLLLCLGHQIIDLCPTNPRADRGRR